MPSVAKTKIANDDNATTSFAQGSASYFTTAKWQTYELNFEQEVDGLAEIGIGIDWQSGGSCIMIDNVRLTRLADDYVEPGDPTEDQVKSVTEGIINGDFIDEATMQGDLLQMLANFATYLKNDFQAAQAPNSKGEPCGCFKEVKGFMGIQVYSATHSGEGNPLSVLGRHFISFSYGGKNIEDFNLLAFLASSLSDLP